MLVFVLVILIPLLIQHIDIQSRNIDFEKKNKKTLRFFLCFLIALIMLRHDAVGSDTLHYIHIFERMMDTRE
jgi:hypothetical protein